MPPKTLKSKNTSNDTSASMDSSYAKFLKLFNEKCSEITIDKQDFHKEYINNYNFVIENSSDIKYGLLCKAETMIDRRKGVADLKQIVHLDHIVRRIEKGIFEFALLHITQHKLSDDFVVPVYYDKLSNLCVNLDVENLRIENHTLLPNVVFGSIDPYFLSFLSPEQLHPKRWSDVVYRFNLRDKAKYEMNTTDIYKCKKCGEKKNKISQLQTRSLDEPVTIYVVCLVCYHTFKM